MRRRGHTMHAGRMHADTSRTGTATDDLREPTREREPRTDAAPVRDAPDAAPVVPVASVDTARLVVPPAAHAPRQPLREVEAAANPRDATEPLSPTLDSALRADDAEEAISAPLASRGPTDEELRTLDRILQASSASQATAAHGPTADALDDLDRLMREAPKGRAAPSAEELFRADLAAAAAEPPRDFHVEVGSAPPVRRTAPPAAPAPPPPAAPISPLSPPESSAEPAQQARARRESPNARLDRAPAIAARETRTSGERPGLDPSASRAAAVAPLADTRTGSPRRTWPRSLPRLSRREVIAWSAAYAAALAIGAGVGLYNSTRHAAPAAERGTPRASVETANVETNASRPNPPAPTAAVAAPSASSDPAIDPRANRRPSLDARGATAAPQVRTPLSGSPQNSLAATPSSASHNRGRADKASSVGAADAVGSRRARTGLDVPDGRGRGRAAAASSSPTGASPLTVASIASIASTGPPVSPPPSLSTASPSSASPSSASSSTASAPPSSAPPSSSPTAARSADSVADRPLASAPAVASTAVAREAFRVAADAKDTASISSLLARYERGYGALDSAAVASVWPSVDRAALARAFEGLQSQRLQLDRCRVTVAGASATAACHGSLRIVRRVGSHDPLDQSLQWAFRLERQGADWVIASVRAAR